MVSWFPCPFALSDAVWEHSQNKILTVAFVQFQDRISLRSLETDNKSWDSNKIVVEIPLQ